MNTSCDDIPGTWSNWSHFSDCSVTCGGGTRVKTRTCLTGVCRGDDNFKKICKMKKCPSKFKWGEWSEFGKCSKECGG